MVELVFLGSGGGRFQTVEQHFKTGGFRLHANSKVHIDPGPGALLLSHQYGLNPLDLDGIVVTHCHPDHYNDAEILVEAMTQHLTKRRGALVCSRSVIEGVGSHGPAISKYHQKKPEQLAALEPGQKFHLEGIDIEAMPSKHSDPTSIGAIFRTADGAIGYTGDTQYFDGIEDQFRGVRVLIANVTRPLSMRIPWHLCSDDLIRILEAVKPELAVMIHMGMLFLKHPPAAEAPRIKSATGVETVPGHPGLRVEVGASIRVVRPSAQPTLEDFGEIEEGKFRGAQ